ncbi:MAG: beta-lactamase family protein [Flaviramulus sp.]|nr:beta-lactamase family protein [Flaviramulus sp.]
MKRILATIMLFLGGLSYSQTEINQNQIKTRTAKKLAKKFLRKQRIPGMAISVSQNGELIWSKGFGYSSKKPKKVVEPDITVFRIASISKSITAMALAKLLDDGVINLDESIYNYLPDYPKNNHDFNIRQLGGNLAGIRHYKNDNEYALNKKMSITEGLSLFKNDSLLFKPGSQFNYSTFGFVLLSEVIQKAADKPFISLVNDSIFKPLQMENSRAEISDEFISNKTQFYRKSLLKKPVLSSPVANEYKVAGGGFLSTSEDIVKFGNELIFPKIISQKALENITKPQRLITGENTGYGIGFSSVTTKKGTPKYYHTGGGVGASSILLVYPEEKVVITVLTNLTGVNMEEFGKQLESVFVD